MGTYCKTRLMQCGYYSVFVCLMLCSGLGISAARASSCSDYAATPPFLTSSVTPNVVFMLDNSASMKDANYSAGYDPEKTYYGLFDSTKNYAYNDSIPVDTSSFDGHSATSDTPGAPYNVRDSSEDKKLIIDTFAKGAFVEDTSSCTPGPGRNCWNGNFLNWMTTRRIDAARKALVGGKVETRSGFDYLGNSGKTWKIVGNNEPRADLYEKTYASSQNQSPFPNNTTFKISSSAASGLKKDLYDPYEKIDPSTVKLPSLPSLPFSLRDKSDKVIGEIGKISSLKHDKKIVKLLNSYNEPIIIAKPPNFNGDDPATVRIEYSPADKTRFSLWIDEWEYRDINHVDEDVHYMVLEKGTHTLLATSGDMKVVAGSAQISGNLNDKTTNSWQTIDIGTSQFANIPVVIASVTSTTSPIAVTTRIKDINKKNFMITLQREEKDVRTHPTETVHYIAMEPGIASIDKLPGLATTLPGLTARSIRLKVGTDSGYTHNFKELTLADISTEAFVADMQTTKDTEPASLRYKDFSSASVKLKVEEEGSNDSETNHGEETVGYIAVSVISPIYNVAVLNNSEPKGLFQQIKEKVRVGLSCYRYQRDNNIYDNNELTDGGTLRLFIPNNPFVKDNKDISNYRQLDTHVKAATADLIDGVEHYPLVYGTTPLAENLYEVGRYFTQVAPHYDDKPCIKSQTSQSEECETDYVVSKDWDPYSYKINNQDKDLACAKSFVIILTDGDPWHDENVPVDDGKLSVEGKKLENVAKSLYWDVNAKTYKDLRSNLDGKQYIQVPTIAFGKAYIPDNLRNASNNTNSEAYAAEDGEKLEDALDLAITVIGEQTSSGASLSLLSEKTTAGSIINQALIFPGKIFGRGTSNYKVDWIGTINAFWFYNPSNNKNISGISDMREDTDSDYNLDIYDDRALKFLLDDEGSLKIETYNIIRSGENAGTPDEYSAIGNTKGPENTYNNIDDVKKIFDIGKILKERSVTANDQTTRKVYGVATNNTTNKDDRFDFTQTNVAKFVEQFKLPSSATSADIPACLGAVSSPVNSPARDREKTAVANNLISYIRGASDGRFTNQSNIRAKCRTRHVSSNKIWKLGDIIYSTPLTVDYSTSAGKFSRLYTGANDGMLHAFKMGELRKGSANDNQAAKLCDESQNPSTCGQGIQNTIGKEAWTFIPKNALPYLKYLADPKYQHIYTVDLPPYLIQSGGKKILIGGMRFGGATGCTNTNNDNQRFWCGDVNKNGIIDIDADEDAIQTVPPGAIPDSIATDNLGLSSYFALDITDPDDPTFLWEFTDPAMGFSFSGPAFITRKVNETVHKYVMFLSGPLSNKGGASLGQDLKVFILKLDPDTFAITETFKLDGMGELYGDNMRFTEVGQLSELDPAFGGRLFTNGIDSNEDGSTDVVFFGVNKLVGNNWQGNVFLVAPTDADPVGGNDINWEFGKVFSRDQTPPPPITSRIAHGVCYRNNYIYFGSGRWFHKFDTPGDAEGSNSLWGIEIDGCLKNLLDNDDDTKCDTKLTSRDHNANTRLIGLDGIPICRGTGNNADEETSWREPLDGKDDERGHLMERTISDPAFISNVALFTTTEPSSGGCDFGGQFRTWGFNCRTGDSLFWRGCVTTQPAGTLLLQGSGGNIEGARINTDTLNEKNECATDWIPGIPPESGPTFVPDAGKLDGEIILWIER